MRAVLQRVLSARVEVDGRVVSSIGPGILVLVGLLDGDTEVDAEYICRKILNIRLFPNEQTGKGWDHSVIQRHYEVLLVSQFTLLGQLKGNKLDFHVAMPPDRAKPFYESLVKRVSQAYRVDAVKDGVFGAKMQVHLVNDGPVTVQLDSHKTIAKELDQSSSLDRGVRSGYKVAQRPVFPEVKSESRLPKWPKATCHYAWVQKIQRLHTPVVGIHRNLCSISAATQLTHFPTMPSCCPLRNTMF